MVANQRKGSIKGCSAEPSYWKWTRSWAKLSLDKWAQVVTVILGPPQLVLLPSSSLYSTPHPFFRCSNDSNGVYNARIGCTHAAQGAQTVGRVGSMVFFHGGARRRSRERCYGGTHHCVSFSTQRTNSTEAPSRCSTDTLGTPPGVFLDPRTLLAPVLTRLLFAVPQPTIT